MNKLYLIPCIFKSLFGYECPGCGIQRSFILLIKGQLHASIEIYPALIPLILLMLYSIFTRYYPKYKNKYLLIILSIVSFILISFNYYFKLKSYLI
jgi:hypothetical protein